MRTQRAILVTACVALLSTVVAAQGTSDESGATDAEFDRTALSLARALDARLTVWRRPDGRRTYASHCRQSKGGCRARIAVLARLFTEVARAHDVDPFLLTAMAIRESGLNPFATGAAGEMGLVQLHPRGVGSRVRFVTNERYRERCRRRVDSCQREVLEAGARLISQSVQRCGSVPLGLGAYNTGECQETGYSRRVLRERARLVELAKRPSEAGEAEDPLVD